MEDKKYDVVVVGAGPAGYVAAIRCAQLGLATACIDAWSTDAGKPSPGGTCLNVGCIPSKALLDSSHFYYHLEHDAREHGISVSEVSMDVPTMQKRKRAVVQTLTQGVEGLFKKNKIQFLHGRARLAYGEPGGHRLTVATGDGESVTVSTANVILACGSAPAALPAAPMDGESIVDSTGALAFETAPRRLGVIGAGVIGLELGSVWSRLGAEVTILEALDTFLPALDQELAKEAFKVFKKQGLDIRLNATLGAAERAGEAVRVEYEGADGKKQSQEFDKLIVAVGRRPYTEGLGATEAGLKLDERGFIEVDAYCRTHVEGIFAIGDVVRGSMLAHKGSEEGVMVAERIGGQAGHVNYGVIPWVIYTWPEIAWVGQNEEQLRQSGVDYRSGVFPFLASGRARAMGETAGRIKILGDAKTDRILGVHIFGAQASELIAEAVIAMEFDAATEDLARTIHAHPTLAEAVHEAALAVDRRAIHI